MNMRTQAENEIKLCKELSQKGELDDIPYSYTDLCYDSALKAYKSLLSDDHTGLSIVLTKDILNKLIDGKPLSPIEDTEDVWTRIRRMLPPYEYEVYQCKRMDSLFKYVYPDGTINYSDIDRIVCSDVRDDRGEAFHSGFVDDIIDEMFPITMPYIPLKKPIQILVCSHLTDPNNEDFDTRAIISAHTDNKNVLINRYFKEDPDTYKWVEIEFKEYYERKTLSDKLLKENKYD